MLRVRERESGREGRRGDDEHAAVRLVRSAGLARKSVAERRAGEEQQGRQVEERLLNMRYLEDAFCSPV